MYYPGYKSNSSQTNQKIQIVNKAARQATQGPTVLGVFIPNLDLPKFKPH